MSPAHDAHDHGGHIATSELPRVPYRSHAFITHAQLSDTKPSLSSANGAAEPSLPSMASSEYRDLVPEWQPPLSRSLASSARGAVVRLTDALFGAIDDNVELPFVGLKRQRQALGVLEYFFGPALTMRPRTYVDAYTRPNECPECFWHMPWRWPRFRYVNVKIPPPVNGVYNDIYHYLAFQHWLNMEKRVYMAHVLHLQEMFERCVVKEGEYNAPKNCRHFFNKTIAMTRSEEVDQTAMYMLMTGNTAIRETPYPADFVQQKRKVYDDWLQRTRMRRPGDIA